MFCYLLYFRFFLEACKRSEIQIHFQYKFVNWNREEKLATFQKYKNNFS
jgi:hypothetical protein